MSSAWPAGDETCGPHQHPGPGFVDGASAEQVMQPVLASTGFARELGDRHYQSPRPWAPHPFIWADLVSPQISDLTPTPPPVGGDAVAGSGTGASLPGRAAVLDTSGEPGPNAVSNTPAQ